MIERSGDGVYRSSLFESIPSLLHGFTTKQQGDLGEVSPMMGFFDSLDITPNRITMQRQIHGGTVHVVENGDIGKTAIQESDGLIYQKDATGKQPVLVVRTGDCIPLLFVDPANQIIGAVHTGWKGTAEHISRKMIETFISLQSQAQNIRVAIGPSICGNCYTVSQERAETFQTSLPDAKESMRFFENTWHIDIAKATIIDLESFGLPRDHIDYDETLCTLEHPDLFYSYRRKTEPFGEIIGYIGFM